jgi:hypothetical protein
MNFATSSLLRSARHRQTGSRGTAPHLASCGYGSGVAEMLGFDRIRRSVAERRMEVAGVVVGEPPPSRRRFPGSSSRQRAASRAPHAITGDAKLWAIAAGAVGREKNVPNGETAERATTGSTSSASGGPVCGLPRAVLIRTSSRAPTSLSWWAGVSLQPGDRMTPALSRERGAFKQTDDICVRNLPGAMPDGEALQQTLLRILLPWVMKCYNIRSLILE